jgi:hypothetical protein
MNLYELPYEKFKNHIIMSVVIFDIIIFVFFLTFFYDSNNIKLLVKGYFLGAVVSLLNFRLLSKKVERTVASITEDDDSVGSKSNKFVLNFFIRYFIILVVLSLAAVRKTEFNLAATITGVFSVQIVIYIITFLDIIKNKFRSNTSDQE